MLDQSPISEGSTGSDALRNTLDLAELTDALGYHRYWVAEHHGTPTLACASPEVLIGPIAAGTERIRVGSGGVMLPHYSPLSVAERFSILSGLYPGRIDLGHRPRARDRPADDAGAAARPAPARARRLPRAAHRAARLPRGPHARGSPVRAPLRVAPGRAAAAGGLAARLVAAERDLGRRAGRALLVRRLHQPRGRGDSRRISPSLPRTPAAHPARSWASEWSRCARTPTRRPSGWRRADACRSRFSARAG